MESLALVLAALALVASLAALLRARGKGPAHEDLDDRMRRRVDALREELGGELALHRRMLQRFAAGAPLTAEMVAEGRLWTDVDARTAQAELARGAWRALDVRTPRETSAGILAGALCIPVDELEARLVELPRDGKPLVVYCASGARSAAACELLTQAGLEPLYNLEGGVSAWTFGTVRPGAS